MTLRDDLARMAMQAAAECRCDTYENGGVCHCESHGESRHNAPVLVEMVRLLVQELRDAEAIHGEKGERRFNNMIGDYWSEAKKKAGGR